MVWFSYRKGASGFSTSSTAEEVTRGIDASGLVAIVTGASSGVGAETARVLALRGVHVFMCVRNVEAGKNVKEKIIKDNPKAKVDVLELDLASMSSVRKCASEFNSLNQPLNILINNAGVMACPYSLSKDGIELQFATNHLGHFLLTSLLLDKMKSTAKESGIEGKIINLSSWGHRMAYKEGTFEKINDESRYEKWKAYGQSKLANILHANQLSRQFKEEGVQISANAVHPGAVATNLGRHVGIVDGVYRTIGKFIFKNSEQGAATSCYVALHPQVRGVTGKYFANSNEATPSPLATDAKLAEKLRDISMELVQ